LSLVIRPSKGGTCSYLQQEKLVVSGRDLETYLAVGAEQCIEVEENKRQKGRLKLCKYFDSTVANRRSSFSRAAAAAVEKGCGS